MTYSTLRGEEENNNDNSIVPGVLSSAMFYGLYHVWGVRGVYAGLVSFGVLSVVSFFVALSFFRNSKDQRKESSTMP